MNKQIERPEPGLLQARPYQLMCMLCRLGAGDSAHRLRDKRLNAIFQAIRKDPRVPLHMRAYGGNKYGGVDTDSPGGVLYHLNQDALIEAKFGIFMERAQAGLGRLLDTIEFIASTQGICWHQPKAAAAWRGCRLAGTGCYERGCVALKRLAREWAPEYNATKTQPELDAIKAQSAADILKSGTIKMFPHHLLYVVGCYFQHDVPRDIPITLDNLWEPGEAMRRNPNIPVMLVPDHCDVCPPCRSYDMRGSGLCHLNPKRVKHADKVKAMKWGLLDVLRALGLEYYQKLPAWKLLRLAQERITPDNLAFTYTGGAPPSYYAFKRSLNDGLGFLEAFKNPKTVMRRVNKLMADKRVTALLPSAEKEHVRKTLAAASLSYRRASGA